MRKVSSILAVLALGLAAALAAPSVAFAHMAAGADAEVGPYVVDVGWSSDPVVAGEPTTFAFNLADQKTQEPVEFSGVWVRMSSGDRIAFAGTLGAFGRNATFTQTFPAAGEYELTVRYLTEDRATLAEKTFPITVAAAKAADIEKKAAPAPSLPAALALAAVFIIIELAIHPRRAAKA